MDFYVDEYALDLNGTIRKRREILMFVLYHTVSRLGAVSDVPESVVYIYYSRIILQYSTV